jgi:hypothetical protein
MLLIYISLLFIVSCSNEAELEKFGLWIELEGTHIEIPMAKYNPMFGGTDTLKKHAIEISSGR